MRSALGGLDVTGSNQSNDDIRPLIDLSMDRWGWIDVINLGLTKMAESCPGMTDAKLARLQAGHIRDETYSTALAELVNPAPVR
jgi:hypothetical protein